MARMIPPQIIEDCSSAGEKEVFYRLKNERETENWFVLHSLCLANHIRQVSGEIDFVVIIPELGVLCLEVKACAHLRRSDGLWYYGANSNADSRGPFRQAAEAMHSLRSKLLKVQPKLSDTVFWSAALFPYVTFEEDSPEWHEWQVIDRAKFRGRPLSELLVGMMKNARSHLATCKTATWFDKSSCKPSVSQCELIAQTLRGDFEVFESPVSARQRRESEILRFTEEQYCALDAMQSNERVIFAGPAGTGKTVLALEAARRSSSTGQKTLFLCFNKNLGHFLQTTCKRLDQNVETQTLHGLMVDLVGRENIPQDASQHFWTKELPELASLKIIESDKYAAFYDSLIIDEAQDILREEYLEFLDTLLKGGLNSGKWMMFGDFEKQTIYGGYNLESIKSNLSASFPVYNLTINCRNTPRVAATARLLGGLNPDYTRVLRPDGGPASDPIYKFYDSVSEQHDILVETLEKLYNDGFRGSDIVILSPFNPPRSAVASLDNAPWKQRLKPFSISNKDYISFSTVHSFKGLEAAVVVITDIESIKLELEQSILYIAVTRALDRLILLISQDAKKDLINALYAE